MNDAGEAACQFELGSGIKDGDEALGDEIIDLGLEVVEFAEGAGRDDGKVVADFLSSNTRFDLISCGPFASLPWSTALA